MRKLLLYTMGVLVTCFVACAKKELDVHYERPDWLKGNAWEVLEDRGSFTLFLKAVERSGFKDVLDGKSITTVFAPTDEIFSAYLSAHNWSSIEAVPLKELKKLIGYHLVYYAYSQQMLENYKPNGNLMDEPNMAGLYYKYRTRSSDSISEELDVIAGKTRKVFNKDRFLPILSPVHFQTKGIDASSNFNYFFGEGAWKGDSGFNVANAGVTEYAIPTDNGYVYIVDQVLEPLKTIYNTIEEYPEYSEFLKLYDRYRTYSYDEETSSEYGRAGDSLYNVSHGSLPAIASEWTTYGLEDAVSYFDLGGLAYRSFNVFAPDNKSLHTFFEKELSPYYTSLDEVDMLPLALLMYNHVYEGSVVFPAEIGKNADIKTLFGTPIQFDPAQDVQAKSMASNGAFYGLNSTMVPDMFNSVTGPAFRNPNYKIFMYMLFQSGLYQTLMTKDLEYTLFIPSNEVVTSTLFGDSEISFTEGNPRVFGDEVIQVTNADGVLVPLSQSALESFVSSHIVYDKINTLQENKVYRTRTPWNYVYVSNGKVYSTSAFNNKEAVPVKAIAGDWYNGGSFETDLAMLGDSRTLKFTLIGAESSSSILQPYAEFSKLLSKAGLLASGNALSFLFGDRFLLFAPDNETVLKGIADGTIPEDNMELANYLKSYFVSIPENSLSDYPFPGFGVQGIWNTTQGNVSTGYRQLQLIDQGSSLELIDKDGTSHKIAETFPQVFDDGAIYRLHTLLKR